MPAARPFRIGDEAPAPVAGQGGNRDAARDAVAALGPDRIERALHAVEDGIEQTGAEFDRQRPAQSLGDLSRPQTAGIFIELRQRAVAVTANDLADQSDCLASNVWSIWARRSASNTRMPPSPVVPCD